MSIEDKTTEIKQSIGLYDLFGYILPGFFFFAIFIIDYDGSKILRYFDEHKTIKGIESSTLNFKLNYFLDFIYYDSKGGLGLITFLIFIVFCYLVGHIMSAFSSFLAKHTIQKMFRNPSENLLNPHPVRRYKEKAISKSGFERCWYYIKYYVHSIYSIINNNFRSALSLSYRRPFDESFRIVFKKITDRTFKYEVKYRDYYWLISSYINVNYPHCFRLVKHFVNLSGFARNITGTFIFYIIIRIFLHYIFKSKIDIYVCTILTLYIAVIPVMCWTYMKLYKRQAVEMYYMFYSLRIRDQD